MGGFGHSPEIHDGFFIANGGQHKRVDLHKYSGGSPVVVDGQTELAYLFSSEAAQTSLAENDLGLPF